MTFDCSEDRLGGIFSRRAQNRSAVERGDLPRRDEPSCFPARRMTSRLKSRLRGQDIGPTLALFSLCSSAVSKSGFIGAFSATLLYSPAKRKVFTYTQKKGIPVESPPSVPHTALAFRGYPATSGVFFYGTKETSTLPFVQGHFRCGSALDASFVQAALSMTP